MRHYIIHFWQQLPNHVQIDLDSLKALDLNLYSTLEDIYLRLDASLDQLRHLYAIASLNPLWLKKALENYNNESVCRLKLEQSFKWKYRVKSMFQFIHLAKALDLAQLHSSVDLLRQLDYRDLMLVNTNTQQLFILLLDSICRKSATIDNLIESIDDMIRQSFGQIFIKDLAIQMSQIHCHAIKHLTQMHSQKFASCHLFMIFLTDYLLEICQK
ncbi:DNA-binding protein RFX6-like [Oppia nitens]|uniref:DNA-binding protein RFX6-like n=1 Tax=Oppia nitens TaxID=1686743 RepID=UPI0023D9CFFB|nr:DNA-binding protein RFX6-like [Oppia nitens]